MRQEKEKIMVVLLSMKEALIASGMLSRIHLWKLSKEGKFPAPLRLPGDRKCQYFRQDEVIAWKAERAAWKAECAKRSLSRARGGMGTGPDDVGMSAADARKAGNADFEAAEACNAAAVKALEVKAGERIRKGLEADTGADT